MYLLTFSDSLMHEIFVLSRLRTGISKTSQQLPKISDDFAKTSERCRKCLKNDPMIFTHLQSYLKVDKFNIKNLDLFFAEIELNFRYESWVKVLLRSKFNVKFVTKTFSFQLIRSGCTCFDDWNELWRPLSENMELESVGFSRSPLQIYVPVSPRFGVAVW